MNKKTYRILALVLALVMGLGVAGIALADATFRPSSGTAYATDAVNVRSGPGTSYTVLGYLSRGEKVTITGTVSNGWTQIQLPGNRLGYVSSAYLSASYPSGGCVIVTPSGGDRYKVTTGALNVRSGPGTNYRVIAVLEKGDIVTRIGQSGKWFKVSTSNGADAWVSSKYLASVDGTVVIPGDSVTMYATTGVNVRSGPSTSYSIVGGLDRGDKVTRIGTSGNWTKVAWGNGSAYVFSKYLQTAYIGGGSSSGSSTSTYTRYTTTLLNVRSGPSTSYSILGTVGQGQPLSCVGTTGNWTKIIWGSGYAYVYTSYLTSSYYGSVCPPNWNWGNNNVIFGSNQVYMQINAPLYTTNSANWSYYVNTLPAGTRATLLSMSNGWAKIYWNGGVYYTLGSNLAYVK